MTYTEITFNDPNPFKRWLQRQRLTSALKLYDISELTPKVICDFGAGNGELLKLCSKYYPEAKLICYEPTPSLLSEAQQNLHSIANVNFCQDIGKINSGTVDVLFCLEVFEHLPPEETCDALQTICNLLKPEGKIVIGVPVEIGFPALYKGILRMSRRYGNFDANVKNITRALFYNPPRCRPVSEITPGFRFHYEHMGFDFREFREVLKTSFKICKTSSSPIAFLGHFLMPEIYFLAENNIKKDP
jgi:SAM-dependent methyltransferase